MQKVENKVIYIFYYLVKIPYVFSQLVSSGESIICITIMYTVSPDHAMG